MRYEINPDGSRPWNDLPLLPIDPTLYDSTSILTVRKFKGFLSSASRVKYRYAKSGIIHFNKLTGAKASSSVENIFTTDDDLYKAYGEDSVRQLNGPAKEILSYHDALWLGYQHLEDE